MSIAYQFDFKQPETLNDYNDYSIFLESQINILSKQLQQQEKQLQDKTAPLREEATRERQKYKQLERQIEEQQLRLENSQKRHLQDLQDELDLIQKELTSERERSEALSVTLQELTHFQEEKLILIKDLKNSELAKLNLDQQFKQCRQQHLTNIAEQRARSELDQKLQLEELYAQVYDSEKNAINTEAGKLKDLNLQLQSEISLLKKRLDGVRITSNEDVFERQRVEAMDKDIIILKQSQLSVNNDGIQAKTTGIKNVVQEYNEEYEKLQQILNAIIHDFHHRREDMKTQIQSLQKLLYIKCRELFQLKVQAKDLLQKRTDVEAILYKALNENFVVMNSLAAGRAAEDKRHLQSLRPGKQYQSLTKQKAIDRGEQVADRVVIAISRWLKEIDGQKIE